MTTSGGKARRRPGRNKRSTYTKPKAMNAATFRRKTRRGWAAW